MKTILQSIRFLIVLTLLTGVIYPVAVTALSKVLFAKQANGSLITEGDKIIGSELLAQKFADPKYFWPRPSGADYATVASGATNKGPTNAGLVKAIYERREKLGKDAPADLLTASASGLDPHISNTAAHFQIARIAAARRLPEAAINALIESKTEAPQLGILGEPRINVVALNRALDALSSNR